MSAAANTGLLHPDRSAQRVLQLQQDQQHRPQHGVSWQLQASVPGLFPTSSPVIVICCSAVIHPSFSSSVLPTLPGGEPASDLYVDHGGAAGVQPQREPKRPDVFCLPALPGSGQPGPQLELPATKSYPFFV